MHYNATSLHHGVLLVVIHQVSQGVEPLTATDIVLAILQTTDVHNGGVSGGFRD